MLERLLYAHDQTVVCVDYNDYDRLGKIFVNYPEGVKDTGKDLRINIAQIPPERASMSRYNRPCSPEEVGEARSSLHPSVHRLLTFCTSAQPMGF